MNIEPEDISLERIAECLGATRERPLGTQTKHYVLLLGKKGKAAGEIRSSSEIKNLPLGESLRVLSFRDESGLAIRWLSNRMLDRPPPENTGNQMRKPKGHYYTHWDMHPPIGNDRRSGYLERLESGALFVQG